MAKKDVNVALIGMGFMGRTHSNAWGQVGRSFEPPVSATRYTLFGQEAEDPTAFAKQFGWQNASTDWKKTVKCPEVDLVDVATPNFMHAPVAVAALKAGKNVACEKPIAGTLKGAPDMAAVAKSKKLNAFVWNACRRVPAVALAWRLNRRPAGSGANGDLNAQIIDMTRFVTDEEITEISGAIADTFIERRKLMTGVAAGGIAGEPKSGGNTGPVTIDDRVLFLARLSGGAVASFGAARQAAGSQNSNGFEINGTKGSIKFNFERMNELEFYDATIERAVQGWTTVMCTHGGDHHYVDAWWPDAHLSGYERGFVEATNIHLRDKRSLETPGPGRDRTGQWPRDRTGGGAHRSTVPARLGTHRIGVGSAPIRTVAVLMPFGSPFDTHYEQIYSLAARDAELVPIRVDRILGIRPISQEIEDMIRKATVCIGVLSTSNANVLLEIGAAWGWDKPLVLVAEDLKDVPSNFRDLPVLLYDTQDPQWARTLREGVASRIESALKRA